MTFADLMRTLSIVCLLLLVANAHGQTPPRQEMDSLEQEQLNESGTVVSIIFDDSGSMQGERISQAKAAFRSWLEAAPEEHRFGLIALNGGVLVQPERGNKEEVAREVQRLQAHGGTPLANTLDTVIQDIASRRAEFPFERHVLLIFTDGADSTPRGAEGVQDAMQMARGQNIEAVGIGFHGQGDYLADSSTRYFDARNQKQLLDGLQKVDVEIGDTSDIKISPEIEQLMQTVQLEKPTPAPSRANPSANVQPGPSGGGGGGFLNFVTLALIVIGVIFVVMRLFRR